MEKYDVIVIGGGLLGCFTARALTRYRLKLALLEAREDVCTGISRANTAIIYSGADTKPGSLKSEMCVRSAQTFANLCSQLGVRYSPCGSLMISFGPRGEEVLGKKMAQGKANGVRGLALLSREEVLSIEPNVSPAVTAGLFAPEAGTVIPWELGIAAAENALHNGAEFQFNSAVTRIEKVPDGYVLEAGGRPFHARGIINCAGLYADGLHEMVAKPSVRIYPEAGDYYILDTKASGVIRHIIFHEPEEKGKGLTLVPTVDGNILLGPSKIPSGEKNDAFPTSKEGLEWLCGLAEQVIPSLPMEHVIRSFGAVRPNPFYVRHDPDTGLLHRDDKGISDFILHETDGAPNFLSFIGIKTPGLTCALELGLYAADRMAALLGNLQPNDAFNPNNPAPLRLKELSEEARAQRVREKPSYGRIVCRCRGISEGEIIYSIHHSIGAKTVDGVKRRTGAGSGRCQGGFCTQRIIEILSQELGIPVCDIQKDRPGSKVIGGKDHG
jgi:glycerol-3-phosphate dehydrogenase